MVQLQMGPPRGRRRLLVLLAALARCAGESGIAPPLANQTVPCGRLELAGPPNASARHAWVTHVNSDPRYVIQVGVLFTTLKLSNTTGEFVLLCVKCGLGQDQGLKRLGVRLLDTKLPIQQWELAYPYRDHRLIVKGYNRNSGDGEIRSGISDFVKLRVHQLTEYAVCVFLDADMLIRGNIDHVFWLPEGSHADGPRSPFNAGLVVIAPRREDFRNLVAVVRDGNYTDASGWRGEGPCRWASGCNARHVTQGLWDWFYRVGRKTGGPRESMTLPRHVYNALQDEPAGSFSAACVVHFTACGKPSAGACGAYGAAMAAGDRRGDGVVSDRFVHLCALSHQEWAAREAAYCASYGPPNIKAPAKAAVRGQKKVPYAKVSGETQPPSGKRASLPQPCPPPARPLPHGHAALYATYALHVAGVALAFKAGALWATEMRARHRRRGPPLAPIAR